MTKVQALPVQVLKVVRVATIVFALLMMWAVLPAGQARAAGMTEAQIQAVLNLLSTFGTDANTVANVNVALRGGNPDDMKNLHTYGSTTKERPDEGMGGGNDKPPACVAFARTLIKGSQGDDVKNLQDFLKNTGDLKEASTTTYFGPKTEEALRLWQMRMNIASSTGGDTSGYGTFGPITRGQLVERCMKDMHDKEKMGTTTRPLPPKDYPPKPSTGTNLDQPVTVSPVSVSKSVSLISDGVVLLSQNIGENMSLAGDGAASVFQAYLSLFNL